MKTVVCEKKGIILMIRLNRPKVLNAINMQLIREFLEALKEAQEDPEVKVVIVIGEGRAFSSGYDLSENNNTPIEEGIKYIETLQDITRTMFRMDKPIIAAIHGYALGAGCEWAMNCDIRIAAEQSKFGFPETSIGAVVTNGGTKLLPLLVGLGRAKELIFTCERIDAQQAEQWGLVNRVVPLNELETTAIKMAQKIALNSSLSIHLSKSALNRSISQDFEQTLEHETKDLIIAFSAEATKKANAALDIQK